MVLIGKTFVFIGSIAIATAIFIERPKVEAQQEERDSVQLAEIAFRPTNLDVAIGEAFDTFYTPKEAKEAQQLLELKIQVVRLKQYICSNFYTFTCNALRHFIMEIEAELKRHQQSQEMDQARRRRRISE